MTDSDAIVFVVDDDASVRRSTERLLRTEGFVVRTFASADEFLREAPMRRPACLVLDLNMPGRDGLDLQRELNQAGIGIPIIFLTGQGSIPLTVRAMKAGAAEFLTKPARSRDLIVAIRAALERDRTAQQARGEADALRERYEQLTPREREVMGFVVAGLLNKQIAFELAMTERTVKFHRAHLVQKMGADSVAALVRMAERLGIATRDAADPVLRDSDGAAPKDS